MTDYLHHKTMRNNLIYLVVWLVTISVVFHILYPCGVYFPKVVNSIILSSQRRIFQENTWCNYKEIWNKFLRNMKIFVNLFKQSMDYMVYSLFGSLILCFNISSILFEIENLFLLTFCYGFKYYLKQRIFYYSKFMVSYYLCYSNAI